MLVYLFSRYKFDPLIVPQILQNTHLLAAPPSLPCFGLNRLDSKPFSVFICSFGLTFSLRHLSLSLLIDFDVDFGLLTNKFVLLIGEATEDEGILSPTETLVEIKDGLFFDLIDVFVGDMNDAILIYY
jgi:hypothetical protein